VINLSKKKLEIKIFALICIGFVISGVSTPIFARQVQEEMTSDTTQRVLNPIFNPLREKPATVSIIFTDDSDEVLETVQYIKTQIPGVDVVKICSRDDFLEKIRTIDTDVLVYVGHGSKEGFRVSSSSIPWEELVRESESNFAEMQLFISCNSRIVKQFSSKKTNLGFEEKIDSYAAAVFASAIILWQFFPENEKTMDSVLQDMRSNYIIYRMTENPQYLSLLPFPIYYAGLYLEAGYYQSQYTFVATRYHHSWCGISGTNYITYPYGGSSRLWPGDLVNAGIAATYAALLWWVPFLSNAYVDTMRKMSSTQNNHMYWSSLLMNALMIGLGFEAPLYLSAVAVIYNILASLISPIISLVLDTITGNPVLADIIDSIMNLLGYGTLVMTLVLTYIILIL
jgi:hypothetical protein